MNASDMQRLQAALEHHRQKVAELEIAIRVVTDLLGSKPAEKGPAEVKAAAVKPFLTVRKTGTPAKGGVSVTGQLRDFMKDDPEPMRPAEFAEALGYGTNGKAKATIQTALLSWVKKGLVGRDEQGRYHRIGDLGQVRPKGPNLNPAIRAEAKRVREGIAMHLARDGSMTSGQIVAKIYAADAPKPDRDRVYNALRHLAETGRIAKDGNQWRIIEKTEAAA